MEQEEKRKAVEALLADCSEEHLWACIVAFQGEPLRTMSGLPYSYTLKEGKHGGLTKELWVELFSTDYNGLVAVTDIPFYSMCEHHLLPFFGTVDVIYQPHSGCVAGLSKFNDVITVLSRKPQLQERVTREIADAIERDLSAEGVFVRLKATQLCMLMKGTLQQGSQVVTIESRGLLREAGSLRDEALAMLGGTDV